MPGAGEFDPEDTSAEPMLIREQGQGFRRVAGELTGRQDSLGFILRSLASSFSEVLHPLIDARVGEQFYTLQQLVGAMLYAEQVTDGWASDVVAFKQQRAEFLRRWESAQRNGFWVTRAPGYENVEPDMHGILYDDARALVLRDLRGQAQSAYNLLCQAARDRGRQFREGPTPANLATLTDAGLAGGPGAALLYPYHAVTGPRSGLPREYWGLTASQLARATENDPQLAALLVSRRPDVSAADPFEAALARALLISAGGRLGGSASDAASADQVSAVAQILAGIPASELTELAALFPAVVGNLDGTPFEYRIAANRIQVADALHRARQEFAQTALEGGEAGPPPVGYEGGYDPLAEAARQRSAELGARITQYERMLTETTIDYGAGAGPPWPESLGHKVLYFDPTGDGSWAELVGTIDADTESVGILVPGVGTDAPDISRKSHLVTEFVAEADRDGDQLAMIVWAGGDFPDGVPGALSQRYAEDLTASLVDFSYAVRAEVEEQNCGSPAAVTVIGHSYGGLTVARATLGGLSADRILLVNSPGYGAGPISYLVTTRLGEYESYAMDAPWDPVQVLGPIAHGGSLLGTDIVELDTGVYPDGTEITGPAGHDGVFEAHSTAWETMLAVLTGRRS